MHQYDTPKWIWWLLGLAFTLAAIGLFILTVATLFLIIHGEA